MPTIGIYFYLVSCSQLSGESRICFHEAVSCFSAGAGVSSHIEDTFGLKALLPFASAISVVRHGGC